MTSLLLRVLASSAALTLGAAVCQANATQLPEGGVDNLRSWTVEDSIGLRHILSAAEQDKDSFVGGEREDHVQFSPSGKHFFILTRTGNLAKDVNRYELLIYNTQEVSQFLSEDEAQALSSVIGPEAKVSMEHGRRQAIRHPRWVDGGAAVEFIGIDGPEQNEQAYRVSLPTGHIQQITRLPPNAEGFNYETRQGNTVYSYFVAREVPRTFATITPLSIDLVTSQKKEEFEFTTVVSSTQGQSWQLKSGYAGSDVSFSPDGRKAVLLRRPIMDHDSQTDSALDSERRARRQLILVDFEKRSEAPVASARVSRDETILPTAEWSFDGRSLLLINVLGASGTSSNRSAPETIPAIMARDFQRDKTVFVIPLSPAPSLKAIGKEWCVPGRQLVLQFSDGTGRNATRLLTYSGKGWSAGSLNWGSLNGKCALSNSEHVAKPRLEVKVIEGANQPQRLVATLGRSVKDILDEDKALSFLRVVPVTDFVWKDSVGVTHTGGLRVPTCDRGSNIGLPLVIQVERYIPDEFQPDGWTSVASAAQALAARCIAVLSMDFPKLETADDEVKWTDRFLDQLDTAVEKLATDRIIDRDRVGALGFSATGFLVRYAITHPRKNRLATALVADSFSHSYLDYLTAQAKDSPDAVNYERNYGGPFYSNKEKWFKDEVSFNVDAVKTPVLFIDNSIRRPKEVVDTIGGFKANRKQFDYLFLKEGVHNLSNPDARRASMQATVDWMTFWLLKPGDPNRSVTELTKRWTAKFTQ